MSELRKAIVGNQGLWSKDQLRAGFAHFKDLNGRYPTSHEIDAFPYLPSARSIQRTYGGLVALRTELFSEDIANYTLGEYRSKVAKKTFHSGRDYEVAFYDYLITQFQEIAVHEHKSIRPGNVNSDFYIYMDQVSGIVVDIFYAESIINLVNVVNIKLKRYVLITPVTYLVVVGNPSLTQASIDEKVANRRLPLPNHIRIVSEEHFKMSIIPILQQSSRYAL